MRSLSHFVHFLQLCMELANTAPDIVKPFVDILWFSTQAIQLIGWRNTGLLYTYMVCKG